MLRKLYLVPVLALLALPALASAQFEAGNYEMRLSGSGSNDQDFRTFDISLNLGLGYFTTKEMEIGVRQGLIYGDGGSTWSGQTQVFADYHFDMDRWQPYIGANVGYVYGDNVADAWIAGPEIGVKYFVNSTTFIAATVQYVLPFDSDNDEFWQYSVAVGWKW